MPSSLAAEELEPLLGRRVHAREPLKHAGLDTDRTPGTESADEPPRAAASGPNESQAPAPDGFETSRTPGFLGVLPQERVERRHPGTRPALPARHRSLGYQSIEVERGWYVLGEDSIPMEMIVRRTVRNDKSVEVLPFERGAALESE